MGRWRGKITASAWALWMTPWCPYSYTLEPGGTYTGTMVAQVPTGTTQLTVAYQEVLASGKDGAAYFVEASL